MNKKEKVILLQDQEGVGKKFDIKELSYSFAHNFLIPQKKVLIYNNKNINLLKLELEKEKENKRNKENRIKREKEKIDGKELIFTLKKEKEKIFGSVSYLDIIKKLKEDFSVQIEKKNLSNFSTIKEECEKKVNIKFGMGIEASIKIRVFVN